MGRGGNAAPEAGAPPGRESGERRDMEIAQAKHLPVPFGSWLAGMPDVRDLSAQAE